MKKHLDILINGLLQGYNVGITGIFWTILFFLAFLSIYSTCAISALSEYGLEKTFFIKDNVVVNIIVVLLVIVIFFILKKITVLKNYIDYIEHNEDYYLKNRRVLLGIIFIVAFVWVIATQYIPGADQLSVQEAVSALHIKDYSMFAQGGYLSLYPHQLGLVWICYLLSLVFGSHNYLCFQILNVIGLVFFYSELSEICGYFGLKRTVRLMVIVVGILFFPLILYCSFVYGNVLGLAFSVAAVKNEIVFFRTGKLRYALISAGSIMLAILLKSNYIIFLIGILIYSFIELICEKKRKLLFLPIFVAIAYFVQVIGPVTIAEKVSGEKLKQGTSSWSYIAMGMQDGPLAPGWYNGYNDATYRESGYNTDIQADIAKNAVRDQFIYYFNHKRDAVRFFTKKTASQWNNPTFQSFWIVQIRDTAVGKSNWVRQFTSISGEHKSAVFLNLLQIVILAGAMLYPVFFRKNKQYILSLIFPIIFIGGFIFHMFWEAKGQYIISYFVLLIPYAIAGYSALTDCMLVYFQAGFKKSLIENRKKFLGCLLPFIYLSVILTILFYFLYSNGNAQYLTADTQEYVQYMEENVYD